MVVSHVIGDGLRCSKTIYSKPEQNLQQQKKSVQVCVNRIKMDASK